MNRPVPFRPSFSACRPPRPSLSCGSFVSSEVTAARLLAEVANRAQHGEVEPERRGFIPHTLGSAPLMVLGLFKVAPPLETAFSEFPQNSQSRSLPPSVCLSSALHIRLSTRFCFNEQKFRNKFRRMTSSPSTNTVSISKYMREYYRGHFLIFFSSKYSYPTSLLQFSPF